MATAAPRALTPRCAGAATMGRTAAAVAGGYQHTCAARSDGSVWCWGWNQNSQLGAGQTANSSTPVAVQNLAGATFLSNGYQHGCAVRTGGSVWCWGDNVFGQLG